MGNDARRMIVGMLVALAVYIAYQYVINKFYPPRPPAPATTTGVAQPPEQGTSHTTTAAAPASGSPATSAATAPSRPALTLVTGADTAPIVFGGEEGDALRMELTPHGAGLATLQLYARDKKGRFVYRTAPHENEPYELIIPVDDGKLRQYSFATHRIWIEQYDQSWNLADVVWTVAEKSAHKVVFTTKLTSGFEGGDLLRLTKTYALEDGKPIFDLSLVIENIGTAPLNVLVEQDGPLGICEESPQSDMRRLLTAQSTEKGPELNRSYQWADLQKATLDPKAGYLALLRPNRGPFLWTALTNKYFAVYTRPLPTAGNVADYIVGVNGMVVAPHVPADATDMLIHGDLLARMATKPTPLAAGTVLECRFQIYVGPKDAEHARAANPDFADKTKLYYQLAQSADTACFCTFLWLEELMVWLLGKIYLVVRNYGVAIMILVVIIRSMLHPLSVWQQKSMFRMQESMARVAPKLEAIKEKYPNDKVKQNQESMKLYAEEGVNPAASMVAFVPLFLQMPILVALWTALNTDIHLRHAPFDGWWIIDLAAPDSFLVFNPPVTVPILGDIPLIGSVFTKIASLNLLPILMGVSMWLQQKYMPKPHHVQVKLEAAKKRAAESTKPKSGMSPEDQLRQQRIMAYLMAVLFPLMFYKMPAGLNLYWLSTNVFGICESLIIRKQIDDEKRRRAEGGPDAGRARRPGMVARFLKQVVEQAEELQKKADKISQADDGRKKDSKKKP